ncbi:MAG: roadblock/LC7 domain-containing protein [Calditrichaeota bacterium]|nr:roadblock/LC7 domain-containing protein [Calditrichota bacterium]
MSPYQKFTELVEAVNRNSRVLDAAILVNSDGLILASSVQHPFSEESIGALGAQFSSNCEQFSQNIGHGEFEITLVSSKKGYAVTSNLKNKIYFVAKAVEKTDIATVMSSALKVVNELKKMEKELFF